MPERVFISIGSNLGDSLLNCKMAARLLQERVRVKSSSSFYDTLPWGVTDQPKFVNLAIEIETELKPLELLTFLKSIESRMGRLESEEDPRWGPRVIDLDIIFYGDQILDCVELTIPHPLMSDRAFVLVPLSEIIPGFVHPVLKKSVAELLALLDVEEASGAVKVIE